MSTHPNAILMAVLTPAGWSRERMQEIVPGYDQDSHSYIEIGDTKYNAIIMESDYDERFQISAREGDLIFFDMITYGYGDRIAWDRLTSLHGKLQRWALETCQTHHCSYKIFVTANYW